MVSFSTADVPALWLFLFEHAIFVRIFVVGILIRLREGDGARGFLLFCRKHLALDLMRGFIMNLGLWRLFVAGLVSGGERLGVVLGCV